MHVNIHKQLTGEITKRQTHGGMTRHTAFTRVKTFNNLVKQPQSIGVLDVFLQNLKQNLVIYVREKLSDIALQNPTGAGVISAHLKGKSAKTIERFVRAFS